MANTIGQGSANALPFYNVSGTDLVPMTGGVSYDKTNKILTIPGFTISKPIYTGGYGFSGMSFQNFYAGQLVNSFNFVRGRGNFTTKSVPLSGDQLANIVIAGWGGTTPVVGANIKAILVGSANTTSMPTELVFSTNNGTALADRLKITKDGQLNVDTISSFSTPNLTLAPFGQVVLGAPDKVRITGGTNGQALVTDGEGNLSWATISAGSASGPLRPPVYSSSQQRDAAIPSPATGMIVSSPTSLQTYHGSAWKDIGPESGQGTVSIRGSAANFTAYTAGANTLTWSKVGNFCHWQLTLIVSGIQGGSGQLVIEDLPYLPKILPGFKSSPVYLNIGSSTTDALAHIIYEHDQTFLVLEGTKSGGLNGQRITVANLGSGFSLFAQGMYPIS